VLLYVVGVSPFGKVSQFCFFTSLILLEFSVVINSSITVDFYSVLLPLVTRIAFLIDRKTNDTN